MIDNSAILDKVYDACQSLIDQDDACRAFSDICGVAYCYAHFCLQRKRIATKTGNPRLLKIHFHTFRYWKGTILYHQTKDMYYVMQRLGHKNIKNTLLYVQLEEALFQGEQDYISKVAKTEKDVCSLIEAGFECVTEFEGAKIFRKRKL